MRRIVALLTVAVSVTGMAAQEAKPEKPAIRFGVEPEIERYPQTTPKDTLRSVLKAINDARVDYLLAQLTDPEFVDQRVKDRGGKFDKVVEETKAMYAADPEKVRTLRRLLADGEFEEAGDAATVKLKDVKLRSVFLKRVAGRWYLENRVSAEPKSPPS
jgi:hypothetical protein